MGGGGKAALPQPLNGGESTERMLVEGGEDFGREVKKREE